MKRSAATIVFFASLLLLAAPAKGFVLVGTDAAQIPGPETHVFVLHENGRSVVVVSQTLQGPAKPVAIVWALPKAAAPSLSPGPTTLFERANKLAAPRMDELWELDPCELHPEHQNAPPTPPVDTAPSGSTDASAAAGGVTVGPYEVTVLSDADSANAAKWFLDRGYKPANGTVEALGALVRAGASLAVARIDASTLTFDQGVASLPPLSFVLDGTLSLPIQLAALGSRGQHDVVMDVLSPGARLESATTPNVAVPTNLNVLQDARSNVDSLYRSVVDYTFEKAQGSVLTEYAWLASSCDGCADGRGLSADDLLALGSARLPSAADGSQREVMVEVAETLSRAPEGPAGLKSAIASCYNKVLGELGGLAGEAKVVVQTGADAVVSNTKIQDASAEALGKCVEQAATGVKMDKENATGLVSARFALLSRAYLNGMVLTRMRARLNSAAAANLELRKGAAIEGGREEGPTGEPEKKVYFALQINNFRSRFVVRHPWEGPLGCEEPKRGVWGPKPRNTRFPGNAGTSPPPPSMGASATALVPTAQAASAQPAAKAPAPSKIAAPSSTATPTSPAAAALALLLQGGELPDVAAFSIPYRPLQTPAPPKPTVPATNPEPTPATSGRAAAPSAGGCGCRTAPGSEESGAWLAITAIGWFVARRRSRKA